MFSPATLGPAREPQALRLAEAFVKISQQRVALVAGRSGGSDGAEIRLSQIGAYSVVSVCWPLRPIVAARTARIDRVPRLQGHDSRNVAVTIGILVLRRRKTGR